jgi:hypothetical protein
MRSSKRKTKRKRDASSSSTNAASSSASSSSASASSPTQKKSKGCCVALFPKEKSSLVPSPLSTLHQPCHCPISPINLPLFGGHLWTKLSKNMIELICDYAGKMLSCCFDLYLEYPPLFEAFVHHT